MNIEEKMDFLIFHGIYNLELCINKSEWIKRFSWRRMSYDGLNPMKEEKKENIWRSVYGGKNSTNKKK